MDPIVRRFKANPLNYLSERQMGEINSAADQTVLNDITDMAAAAVGGRRELIRKPIFVLYAEPTSPLVHTAEAVEKLLYMAEQPLPTNYSPGIMAGATSPVTIAGAIAQAPDITDRQTHQEWVKQGGTTMGQRARSRVEQILKTHVPEPLPDETNARIDDILNRAGRPG